MAQFHTSVQRFCIIDFLPVRCSPDREAGPEDGTDSTHSEGMSENSSQHAPETGQLGSSGCWQIDGESFLWIQDHLSYSSRKKGCMLNCVLGRPNNGNQWRRLLFLFVWISDIAVELSRVWITHLLGSNISMRITDGPLKMKQNFHIKTLSAA